jgi:hypothetical protein
MFGQITALLTPWLKITVLWVVTPCSLDSTVVLQKLASVFMLEWWLFCSEVGGIKLAPLYQTTTQHALYKRGLKFNSRPRTRSSWQVPSASASLQAKCRDITCSPWQLPLVPFLLSRPCVWFKTSVHSAPAYRRQQSHRCILYHFLPPRSEFSPHTVQQVNLL